MKGPKAKACTKCKRVQEPAQYSRCPHTDDRLQSWCRDCTRVSNREVARKASRTFRGWCRSSHNAIRARCTGTARGKKACPHIYVGLPFCSWEEFWAWAQDEKAEWETLVELASTTGQRRYRPSVDRLSAHRDVGYVPGNMRIAARGDNSSKAAFQYWHGRNAVSPYHIKEQN